MKKLVTIATTLACVAVLGIALQGSASDEQTSSSDPASSEASEVSAMPCCQTKSAKASSETVAVGKTRCCDSGQANEGVPAKTKSCSGEACQLSKTQEPAAAKCGFCKDEDCQVECSSCAEAKHASAVSEDSLNVARGRGKGMGRGQGMGRGRGMGHGHAGDSQHAKDHEDFFFLIEHRESIRRTVKNLPNGIEALTESDVPEVAEMIQVHVEAMYDRVENTKPIRMRDPIFRAIFSNADKIKMEIEHTEHGVRVTETSTDPYVVKLLQEHAKVVSLWVKNGYAELPKNHPAPKRQTENAAD